MSVVEVTKTVNGSINDAWLANSRLEAIEDWHPNVAKVEMLTPHDSGVGATRRLEFQDGRGDVEEVIAESAPDFITFSMTEAAPMKTALVTISFREKTADVTDVTFSIDYSVKYGPIGWVMDVLMMRKAMEGAFGAALDGLSYHLETGELVGDMVPEN